MNPITVLTDDQFKGLLEDRNMILRREAQALSDVSNANDELFVIKAGLRHYTKEDVAEFFCCSTKQVERFEKEGYLRPVRLGKKVIYSALSLIEFAQAFRKQETIESISEALPRKRKRTS
ncbi:hypothetical protein [Spirosoma fluviale]|uniref:Helix-turn-helix domain-containing protein n=1 Tax=Spirosoma fluviale TaxID=1597977 RepID=A0A286FDP5_9BACT|nr:hypothetical protein [Spirosoma fluviale]SOD81109.1 hypothetical protein SAMN06269250_1677 [Spirosoma fluviale]